MAKRRLRTCRLCASKFYLEPQEKNNNRCPECREKSRHKKCKTCGNDFRDGSDKNTRRYCNPCIRATRKEKTGFSERTSQRRKHQVKKGSGRLDDLYSLTPFTNTWWGRVGETLFQYLYPQALDAVELYGNKAAFDFECRSLGRIDVKTAKESKTKYGLSSWNFQIEGVNKECDHAFFIGFDKEQTLVKRAWLLQASGLPDRLKVMTPASSEYQGSEQEVPEGEVTLMSRKFSLILEQVSGQREKPGPKKPERPEYERIVLGRIGEAIYANLHPDSLQVSKKNPVSTYDFKDSDETTVNVRVRRPYQDGNRERWTFFKTRGCTAEVYFYLGLDPIGSTVERALRIPTEDLPPKGFSLARSGKGKSKWLKYSVDLGLPRKISEFTGVEDFEKVHVEVTSFNASARESLSPSRLDLLLQQAFSYHRVIGFPYTSIPSDKKILSEIGQIRRYEMDGKKLPRNNACLGLCSAYMPHRFEAKNSEADFSALGAFENDERLMRALRFCSSGSSPSLRRRSLRSALTALNRTPVSFRPAVSAALCKKYVGPGGSVLDPCAGWGGRLVGALSVGCSYTGIEPSEQTCEGLYQIGSRLSDLLSLDRHRVNILRGRIQEVSLEKGWADFALTSPPYWLKESYPGVVEEASFKDWIQSFLYPLFEKVKEALKSKGRFAIAVSDITVGNETYPLVEVTRRVARDCGYLMVEVLEMEKYSFGQNSTENHEEILVFEAPVNTSTTPA